MKTRPGYKLDFDNMDNGYIYTKYDVGGYGHSVVIEAKDKEQFLDEFAKIWRDRANAYLEECLIDEDNYIFDEDGEY